MNPMALWKFTEKAWLAVNNLGGELFRLHPGLCSGRLHFAVSVLVTEPYCSCKNNKPFSFY